MSQDKRLSRPPYRAYLLEEHVRRPLERPLRERRALLDQWLVWASHARPQPMVRVARSIGRVRTFIDATLEHRLNNGRVERINAKNCPIQQRPFGFHHPRADHLGDAHSLRLKASTTRKSLKPSMRQ